MSTARKFATPISTSAPRTDRSRIESIRELLHHYGLRVTMFRIKVIDILLNASGSQQVVYLDQIRTQVGSELSSQKIREVIRRLAFEGVLSISPGNSFDLTVEARSILARH
ncbi:fe2+ zn2+ uptake regulation protein [Pseudomonas fontis]|uniref:Fe2+ zn2+ uptake regulation protein n=1 Tax=Pseudomonas fontis TaxID=2942633 RepID=A0ABT5NY81_9PSED|nr:fe2+ zn2+ uptake regulation protein [Pseudomonas fontis]MDD0972540.1 fe2+ zn2+ uptake regulation protein [Pseudomonas fontis]MDD0993064.1 fe2+ zn2+ uptake regulation protein [Pseudomonas fontis]